MGRRLKQSNTATDADGATRALLGELIDYAGLFPPARLSMREALAAYERAEASPYYWMLGRFVVTASRLDELLAELDEAPDPLSLCAIVDGDFDEGLASIAAASREHGDRVSIETIEMKWPQEPDAGLDGAWHAAPLDATIFVEVPLSERSSPHDVAALAAELAELARAREAFARDGGAKVRCGGLVADAAPTAERLAHFIDLARRVDLPFKATAGLHHAIRHYNAEAGFVMHGFLNVIGAAILARTHGLGELALERMISDEDPTHFTLDDSRFAWRGTGAGASEIGVARARSIRSYGSCSFTEPVEDLIALGMLQAAEG